MGRGLWLLLIGFALLIAIAIWTLFDNEAPPLSSPEKAPPPVVERRRLIAYGDSLTAGYQLLPEESFPAQLQALFDQDTIDIDVINAGKSGDTSAQMRERLEWSLADTKEGDIFLITAGANDGLQGLPTDQLEENLKRMIEQAKARGLIVVIGGMKLPRNYGSVYTTSFDALYPWIAKETNTLLIPFILEGVATIPSLNLDDGVHPNAAGYKIIAKTVYDFLNSQGVLQG